MNRVPRLLNYSKDLLLPEETVRDIRLDTLFSKETVEILRRPCGREEIKRRNSIFRALESGASLKRLDDLLSILCALEKKISLVKDEKIALIRYFRYAQMLDAYTCASKCIAESGDLFGEIGEYYSSDKELSRSGEILCSANRIKDIIERMRIGLISLSDKCWITPDRKSVSEIEIISECAEKLGLCTGIKKEGKVKINEPFSDAVCRLYSECAERIDAEIKVISLDDIAIPVAFISELRFFSEIAHFVRRAEGRGILHCISDISETKCYEAEELYDISLLSENCGSIVPNGLAMDAEEPFFFVCGANGGGKTTFLRAVGINLVLFLAGCPIFAKSALIYPFDNVLTHFPRDERFDNVGRLDEEHSRSMDMLDGVKNGNAFFLYNETYSGADEERGFEMLAFTAEKTVREGHFGLYVTHFHRVGALEYPILSAVVDTACGNKRTYRIIRSGRLTSSYANDILKKYRLDRASLQSRRSDNGI